MINGSSRRFPSMIMAAAIVALIAAPSAASIWIALMGLGTGPSFVLALSFIGLRTSDHQQAASLSLMAQSIGYLIAALGPFAFGVFHDFTRSWTVPLILLTAMAILQAIFGFAAGKNARV